MPSAKASCSAILSGDGVMEWLLARGQGQEREKSFVLRGMDLVFPHTFEKYFTPQLYLI